ncbi:peptide-methionine (S)-S-oxide reductase MsrA [Jiella flava]|uniref:Peptide methionine sulfoxide reductase MsrA n=1 Tax=Jiella flava TaxID=2816857 RepID=A0A939FY53_9HYPH|nr:peptide-methionine (S)-S-oxide reductase MsrA [Jiella flava]
MKRTSAAALAGAVTMALGLAGIASSAGAQKTETAIFAGGCFWCVESDFDHVKGVLDTTSGYIGGQIQNPTYENHPGFREAVRITFDPSKVSYKQLLTAYWHSVDPTDGGGQFCDRGHSYTTAIYATSKTQLKEAESSEVQVKKDLGTVATAIAMAPTFWPAEGYHQNYYQKNPLKYRFYRTGCGRNARVKQIWGDKAYMGIGEHMG